MRSKTSAKDLKRITKMETKINAELFHTKLKEQTERNYIMVFQINDDRAEAQWKALPTM